MTTPRIKEIVNECFDFPHVDNNDWLYLHTKDIIQYPSPLEVKMMMENAVSKALTEAYQAGIDEERGRCLRWIGTKSAIFNLFNGDNKNLNVNGQNEYKDLVDRIKSGD